MDRHIFPVDRIAAGCVYDFGVMDDLGAARVTDLNRYFFICGGTGVVAEFTD